LSVHELEAGIRAHLDPVAELDIEVPERLEEPCVAQRSGIDRVEADLSFEREHVGLCRGVVARRKRGKRLVAELAVVHVLREHGVERLYNTALGSFF